MTQKKLIHENWKVVNLLVLFEYDTEDDIIYCIVV